MSRKTESQEVYVQEAPEAHDSSDEEQDSGEFPETPEDNDTILAAIDDVMGTLPSPDGGQIF